MNTFQPTFVFVCMHTEGIWTSLSSTGLELNPNAFSFTMGVTKSGPLLASDSLRGALARSYPLVFTTHTHSTATQLVCSNFAYCNRIELFSSAHLICLCVWETWVACRFFSNFSIIFPSLFHSRPSIEILITHGNVCVCVCDAPTVLQERLWPVAQLWTRNESLAALWWFPRMPTLITTREEEHVLCGKKVWNYMFCIGKIEGL